MLRGVSLQVDYNMFTRLQKNRLNPKRLDTFIHKKNAKIQMIQEQANHVLLICVQDTKD
jgi:hypothetical protein